MNSVKNLLRSSDFYVCSIFACSLFYLDYNYNTTIEKSKAIFHNTTEKNFEKHTNTLNKIRFVHNQGDDIILKFQEDDETKNFSIKKGDLFQIYLPESKEEILISSNKKN